MRQGLILRLHQGGHAGAKAVHEFRSMRRLYAVGYPVPQVRTMEVDAVLARAPRLSPRQRPPAPRDGDGHEAGERGLRMGLRTAASENGPADPRGREIAGIPGMTFGITNETNLTNGTNGIKYLRDSRHPFVPFAPFVRFVIPYSYHLCDS